MNDQAAGWSPASDDDERRRRSAVERTLMERARRAAEHDRQKAPRHLVQHAFALAAALALVLVVALGFDAFLTSMQKVMRMIEQEDAEQRQQAQAPEPAWDPAEPMPAYVVPPDPPPESGHP